MLTLVLYISCQQLGDMCNLLGITVNVSVPNCPLLHYGAKLSTVPNCPRCQIVHFWPAVPNCPRCQIVHFTLRCQIVLVPNCPLLHCGAKLSANMGGAKLSTVPNCPRCQIVLGPYYINSKGAKRARNIMRCDIHDSLNLLKWWKF